MFSPFEQALAMADQHIQQAMMNDWQINDQVYLACFDESPNMMNASADERINGTIRTLTLFKSSGYIAHIGDKVSRGKQRYLVQGFSFMDGLIILQLE